MSDEQSTTSGDQGSSTCTPGRAGLRARQPNPSVHVKMPKKHKTSAEASRDYRERLKQDPELYVAHREYENARVKAYVAQISEEKKAQYRQKTRQRVQKY